MNTISSLPMPRSSSDSDSDDEESALGLVMDRSAASSTVSLQPEDRVDALKRTNAELVRKLMEAEKTLQNTMSEHELELEETHSRLEELKSELSATKREEKELRSKEVRFFDVLDPLKFLSFYLQRQNSTQIAALESEIAKLQKSLDNARTSYQSLQKQYQEQCST
jgi:DNA repair exonuclease SbcCD ATPase subunit